MPVISGFNEDTKKYKTEYDKAIKSQSKVVTFVPRMFFLFGCAFISLWGIVSLVKTIPNLSLPTSIEAVKKQAIILENYSNRTWEGYIHIFTVFSLIYVWKQAFSIPGAIFLNILAGALYGPFTATLLSSILTSIGASCAYLLSKFIGQPMIDQYLSDKLNFLRKQVDENRDGLFFYLLFIRMFPLSPWWLLNLASPLLYIPIGPFFASMFFGSIPYNLACCQAGDILFELTSTADIWQPALLLKMMIVSLLSLIPPFYSKRLKKWNELRIKTSPYVIV
ncbi:1105_t:CDS:2 [Funneliformis caledonium]|uniref:1105_t:CDS:1 n=1 Tax=Funneliformis caledonium TaxID=1117310 RepID=A0A9N9GWX7_9GLOM|nr:1105_t:CDS:2 [Funneliformis caledonium]